MEAGVLQIVAFYWKARIDIKPVKCPLKLTLMSSSISNLQLKIMRFLKNGKAPDNNNWYSAPFPW